MKKKKRNRIRVVYHPPTINYPNPKPDCPHCHKGILQDREYVEVATEKRDEIRSRVWYCPECEWIFDQ